MDVEATVRVGKNGITPGVIEEIKSQLKKKKIIKIKFLQNTDRDCIKEKAEKIAKEVNARVVEVRGFTVTLEKRGGY